MHSLGIKVLWCCARQIMCGGCVLKTLCVGCDQCHAVRGSRAPFHQQCQSGGSKDPIMLALRLLTFTRSAVS